MRHFFAATAIAALCAATPALSQTSAKPETNCNTTSNTTTGKAGKTGDSSMAIGSSAILPDAGGEKHSAAPTVQQDGKAMVASKDCPPPTKSKE
jgi:hypothetical protein